MRRVGFLPEHFRFPAWLTAQNFLDMHGQLYGLSAAERRERIPPLLDRVGLGGRGRSKLGEYSKGMQQRVGLAQALLNRPTLVFLDEPTSGLDPVGRYEVREIIRELREPGRDRLPEFPLPERGRGDVRPGRYRQGRAARAGRDAGRADQRGAVRSRSVRPGLTERCWPGWRKWGKVMEPRRQARTAYAAYTCADRGRRCAAPDRRVPGGWRRSIVPACAAAAVARGAVHAGDGGGDGMNVLKIAGITFIEARWRKIAWAVVLLGLAFLLVFGVGFYFMWREVGRFNDIASIRSLEPVNFFLLAGFYGIAFLGVALALLISVDTIAGEIASGTIQTARDEAVAALGGGRRQVAGPGSYVEPCSPW